MEDGLSLIAAGCANVAAILGIGRLGKVLWPWGVRKLIIARDDDPSGSPGDNALYRGVIRQLGQGLVVHVAPRPRTAAPGANVPLKDANDLHRHDSELVRKWLKAPVAGPEDLGPEARNAALDEISRLSGEHYDRARKATAAMLGLSRVKALDNARTARIAERLAQQMDGDEEEDEAWPDPVTDIGEVLDAAAIEVGRYIKASATAIDAIVLWSAAAHILQRSDLKIIISPRLYIQIPVPNCGKTTLLEIVMAATPRSQMVSSTSVSGLFRETHARKPTWGFDEFDKILQGASQEHLAVLDSGHRRTSAFVIRTTKTADGQFVTERFSTFTAMAFTGIKKLPDAMASRCITIALQRAGIAEELEHLIDGSSVKLIEIRRKLARWGQDLTELPVVDRPRELRNRLGDNWYVIRQIAKAAGDEWCRRAMAAALTPTMARDTNVTLALLDAIWRAFGESKRSRMHTANLLSELLDMDEGWWREARHGQPITSYFLRDSLEDMLPPDPEAIAPRRWREGAGNPQFGYDVLHFKDAFQRYLGRGLPVQVADEAQRQGSGAQSKSNQESDKASPEQTAREKTPKRSDTSDHPTHGHETEDTSEAYSGSDGCRMPVSDQANAARKRHIAERERRIAVQKRSAADPTRASDTAFDTAFDTEKNEQNEATTWTDVGLPDVSDTKEGSRAHTASERRNRPKGAAGRKPRKAM